MLGIFFTSIYESPFKREQMRRLSRKRYRNKEKNRLQNSEAIPNSHLPTMLKLTNDDLGMSVAVSKSSRCNYPLIGKDVKWSI